MFHHYTLGLCAAGTVLCLWKRMCMCVDGDFLCPFWNSLSSGSGGDGGGDEDVATLFQLFVKKHFELHGVARSLSCDFNGYSKESLRVFESLC